MSSLYKTRVTALVFWGHVVTALAGPNHAQLSHTTNAHSHTQSTSGLDHWLTTTTTTAQKETASTRLPLHQTKAKGARGTNTTRLRKRRRNRNHASLLRDPRRAPRKRRRENPRAGEGQPRKGSRRGGRRRWQRSPRKRRRQNDNLSLIAAQQQNFSWLNRC